MWNVCITSIAGSHLCCFSQHFLCSVISMINSLPIGLENAHHYYPLSALMLLVGKGIKSCTSSTQSTKHYRGIIAVQKHV